MTKANLARRQRREREIAMKVWFLAAVATALSPSPTHSAGGEKKVVAVVDETQLQGYLTTQPAGWTQKVEYNVATDAGAQEQKIVAVVSGHDDAPFSGAYPRTAISTISLSSGFILTKDYLPREAQLAPFNCLAPCLFRPKRGSTVRVRPDKSLPNRLLVFVTNYEESSAPPSQRTVSVAHFTYAFDPAAGAVNRWTLLDKRTMSKTFSGFYGSLSLPNIFSMTMLDRRLYFFLRSSPTTMQVFQVTSK